MERSSTVPHRRTASGFSSRGSRPASSGGALMAPRSSSFASRPSTTDARGRRMALNNAEIAEGGGVGGGGGGPGSPTLLPPRLRPRVDPAASTRRVATFVSARPPRRLATRTQERWLAEQLRVLDAAAGGGLNSKKNVMRFRLSHRSGLVERTLLDNDWLETQSPNDWNLWWSGAQLKSQALHGVQPWQRVNRFPGTVEMTNKAKLAANLRLMRERHGARHFSFVPSTYELPAQQRAAMNAVGGSKGELWIAKPSNQACGRGIYLTRSVPHTSYSETVVLSQYVNNPLLIDLPDASAQGRPAGHKSDLRFYVLVTSFAPLRVYIYEEGLTRFCTRPYEGAKDDDLCAHLTNYSINKKENGFVENAKSGEDGEDGEESGHKWSHGAFRRQLRKGGHDDEALWEEITRIVTLTCLSVAPKVREATLGVLPSAECCFELLGFDILVDENIKPWLIEVNLSPSLACSSSLDTEVKSQMVADALTLVGVPLLNSRSKARRGGTVASRDAGARNRSLRRNHRGFSLGGGGIQAEAEQAVAEAAAEFERKGGWTRAYPRADSSKLDIFLDASTFDVTKRVYRGLFGGAAVQRSPVRKPSPSSLSSAGRQDELRRPGSSPGAAARASPPISSVEAAEEDEAEDEEDGEAAADERAATIVEGQQQSQTALEFERFKEAQKQAQAQRTESEQTGAVLMKLAEKKLEEGTTGKLYISPLQARVCFTVYVERLVEQLSDRTAVTAKLLREIENFLHSVRRKSKVAAGEMSVGRGRVVFKDLLERFLSDYRRQTKVAKRNAGHIGSKAPEPDRSLLFGALTYSEFEDLMRYRASNRLLEGLLRVFSDSVASTGPAAGEARAAAAAPAAGRAVGRKLGNSRQIPGAGGAEGAGEVSPSPPRSSYAGVPRSTPSLSGSRAGRAAERARYIAEAGSSSPLARAVRPAVDMSQQQMNHLDMSAQLGGQRRRPVSSSFSRRQQLVGAARPRTAGGF